MKQYTVRLNEEQVAQLDKVMDIENAKNAQQTFEVMLSHYLELSDRSEYWQDQHDILHQAYKDQEKQIELLKELIYNLKVKG